MLFHLNPMSANEARLMRWMRRYGDALLRTCYLLCGDKRAAREATAAAFRDAFTHPSSRQIHGPLPALLRLALARCPCRDRFESCGLALGRLPPPERKAALLCLYHGLSPEEAAWVMDISPAAVETLLEASAAR